jgi:8-oxo-dGTP diphosphatase
VPRAPELSAPEADRSRLELDVMVGIIEDAEGRVLINQRRAGTHMAGHWEFPGGKRAPDEARFDALARELAEELGIRVLVAEPLIRLTHNYADRRVRLDVWRVLRYEGTPMALERQPLRWADPRALSEADLLPADQPIVEAIAALRRT